MTKSSIAIQIQITTERTANKCRSLDPHITEMNNRNIAHTKLLTNHKMGRKISDRNPIIKQHRNIQINKRPVMVIILCKQSNRRDDSIYPIRKQGFRHFLFQFIRIIGLTQQYVVSMIMKFILNHGDDGRMEKCNQLWNDLTARIKFFHTE